MAYFNYLLTIYEQREVRKIQRKVIRDICDPFDLNDKEFQLLWRILKPMAIYHVERLRDDLQPMNASGLPVHLKIYSKEVTMWKFSTALVVCQAIMLPIIGINSQIEPKTPLDKIVASYIEEYGDSAGSNLPAAISHVMGALMQSEHAKDIGDNLGSILGQFAGAEGTGSQLGTIASVLGQLGAGGGANGNAGDLLSGLGNLLGGGNGQIDPSLMGGMLTMFAQQMMNQPQKETKEKRSIEDNKIDNGVNLDGILSVAQGFLGNMGNQQNPQAMQTVLPLIMNAITAFSAPEVEKKSEEHQDHASFLPPVLEKAHLYWDLFINSEIGKNFWEKSGLKKMLKAFSGPDGKFSFEQLFKYFENQSFRRHWIKLAATYVTEFVMNVAKPEVYQRYLASAQFIINRYIDSQGWPRTVQFNVKRPAKSISALVNYVVKENLAMDADVTEYVNPAIDYIQQTVKMAQTASQNLATRGDYNALVDRVTDTLNLEVIEPVLRVYRAYKHSLEAPHCQEHIMCLVNKHHDQDKQGLPGFKAGLTKISSLVASAALSYQNGKGFWDLYNAIQSDVNCEAAYPADCKAFHEHEMRVTTEPYHEEL